MLASCQRRCRQTPPCTVAHGQEPRFQFLCRTEHMLATPVSTKLATLSALAAAGHPSTRRRCLPPDGWRNALQVCLRGPHSAHQLPGSSEQLAVQRWFGLISRSSGTPSGCCCCRWGRIVLCCPPCTPLVRFIALLLLLAIITTSCALHGCQQLAQQRSALTLPEPQCSAFQTLKQVIWCHVQLCESLLQGVVIRQVQVKAATRVVCSARSEWEVRDASMTAWHTQLTRS